MKKPKTRYFLSAISAMLLISLSILLYLAVSETLDLSRNTTISGMIVCDKPTALSEGNATNCGRTFNRDAQSLFVCGTIDSKNTKISGISILVYKSEEDVPVYVSPVGLRFNNGNFCHEIVLPMDGKVGLYNIRVYYFRKIIASSVLEIR